MPSENGLTIFTAMVTGMIRNNWDYISSKPELLFLFFALPFGVVFTFIIPPLGGSDEGFHYHRIASVAFFQLFNKPVAVPSGIIDFIQSGRDFFHFGLLPPFNYTFTEWKIVSGIQLNSASVQVLLPNYMTVHNPFAYMPQIIAFRAGVIFGLSPLSILYIIRLSGLATAIFITFFAIRLIPSHKYTLCALALLPVITMNRSVINADTIVDGLAFLFASLVLREIINQEAITIRNIVLIAVTGFIMSQCKSPYLLLLFFTLAIPGRKFTSCYSRILSLTVIMLPAITMSVAWIVVIKQTSFSGVSYDTWAGNANPDMQLLFILHHPINFLLIIFRTLFTTSLLPDSILGIIDDIGPAHYLPAPVTFAVIYCFTAVIVSDKEYNGIDYGTKTRLLGACIFIFSFITILALIYIHWSGLYAPEIKGFQGRYFYPLIPMIFPFITIPEKPLMPLKPATYVTLLGLCGLCFTSVKILTNYY